MTIEEVVGTLEEIGGAVAAVTHDVEALLGSEIPSVGETFDSLYYKVEQIDYSAKMLLRQLGDALKQAQEAMER